MICCSCVSSERSQLEDQPRSAEKALKQSKSLAALLPLPPAEQRALALAH